MVKLIRPSIFCLLVLFSYASSGESISWGWSRADTIPFGRSFFQMQSSYQNLDAKYGNRGEKQSLSHNLSQQIKKSEISKMADSFGRTYLKDSDLERVYDIKTSRVTIAPRWSYGFRDWWTFSFQVPVHVEETQVRSTIMKKDRASGVSKRVENNEESFFADQAADDTLAANEYDRINGFNRRTFVGDVLLSNQVRWIHTEHWTLAFRQDLYIPAGPTSDPYNYLSFNNDEGQLDVGGAFLADFFPWSSVSLTSEVYYISQTPDRQQMRVPRSSNHRIDSLIDEDVERDLGNKAGVNVSANYRLSRAFFITTGYGFRLKNQDAYSGEKFDKSSYKKLAKNTDYNLHLANLGITLGQLDRLFNTVRGSQLFAHLRYTHILQAKNIAVAPQWDFALGFSF